jgi:hypothetical protein
MRRETPPVAHLVSLYRLLVFLVAGVNVYRKFYTDAKEQAHGVLGIHVVRPVQKDPVDLVSDILNVSFFLSLLQALNLRNCQLVLVAYKLIDYYQSIETCWFDSRAWCRRLESME